MRIIQCQQRSEAWDILRRRPTASEFARFCTPVKGDYASGADKYAAKVAVKKLGIYIEKPPTDAMQWGLDYEDAAKAAYTAETGNFIEEVGFVLPDNTDAYGGSPDGLVGDDGLLEVKCPQAETLAAWARKQVLPSEYKPQVQGLMMITGRQWCDFWAWHPYPFHFLVRVEADLKYQVKIADNLLRLLEEIVEVERSLFGDCT